MENILHVVAASKPTCLCLHQTDRCAQERHSATHMVPPNQFKPPPSAPICPSGFCQHRWLAMPSGSHLPLVTVERGCLGVDLWQNHCGCNTSVSSICFPSPPLCSAPNAQPPDLSGWYWLHPAAHQGRRNGLCCPNKRRIAPGNNAFFRLPETGAPYADITRASSHGRIEHPLLFWRIRRLFPDGVFRSSSASCNRNETPQPQPQEHPAAGSANPLASIDRAFSQCREPS